MKDFDPQQSPPILKTVMSELWSGTFYGPSGNGVNTAHASFPLFICIVEIIL